MPIKLISLNIERSKHLERVISFLKNAEAEVVCLQELRERDIPRISNEIDSALIAYTPMTNQFAEEEKCIDGIGIFSRLPVVNTVQQYYHRNIEALPESDHRMEATYNNSNRCVLLCEVKSGEDIFRISTTHFTWSAKGQATDLQREDMRALLDILDGLGEFVFCGDFNAPRMMKGVKGEIFYMLADRYKDNIPPQYETSLNPALHRAGKDKPEQLADKMVDGLFTTPHYSASDVELVSGVSDHCAIIANISRV